MEADRSLGLLSLARKAGSLQMGAENVGAACRAGHGRLILVASDAADNAFHRAKTFSVSGKAPMIRVPFDKATLGHAGGQAVCAMACITDVSLARAFVRALDRPEQHADLLTDLDRRVARVEQRRKEEKAHRKNLKHGKK